MQKLPEPWAVSEPNPNKIFCLLMAAAVESGVTKEPVNWPKRFFVLWEANVRCTREHLTREIIQKNNQIKTSHY